MLKSSKYLFLFFAAALIGCGGGSDDPDPLQTGTLSVGITDAPIDEVFEVVVAVTGVTAKPQNGPQISWSFDPARQIRLLDLTGGVNESLIVNEPVPAGAYNWIRFDVDEANSYVRLTESGGQIPLRVPSDRLRFVSGFTITVNQLTSFMVDWDVRKGLTDPVGQLSVTLRPAFRVTDMTAYAAIGGTVADGLVEDDRDTGGCGDLDPNTLAGNVVYLYNQMPHDATFDDIYIDDVLEEGPIATTPVRWNGDMTGYEYRIDFVSPGDYTLAFTCQGASDSPETQDDIVFRSFVDAVGLSHGADQLDRNFE